MLVTPEFAASGRNLHLARRRGEHVSHLFVHWLDLAAPLAIGGLWLWMFFTQLAAAAAARRSAIRTCARRSQSSGRPLMAHAQHHATPATVTPDDEYLGTPEGSSYEHTDANVWLIAKFGFWLVDHGASSSTSAWGSMYEMLDRAGE